VVQLRELILRMGKNVSGAIKFCVAQCVEGGCFFGIVLFCYVGLENV